MEKKLYTIIWITNATYFIYPILDFYGPYDF